MSQISNLDTFEQQNIKEQPINSKDLDAIREKTSSYEELFNKRARKFQGSELKNKSLKDEDFRTLILEEYTFLKRPVIIFNEHIFVGNSPTVVKNMLEIVNQ